MNYFLLQIGNDGEGPVHPVSVSTTMENALAKALLMHGKKLENVRFFFDSKDVAHVRLDKSYRYNQIEYDMFFIDPIDFFN